MTFVLMVSGCTTQQQNHYQKLNFLDKVLATDGWFEIKSEQLKDPLPQVE